MAEVRGPKDGLITMWGLDLAEDGKPIGCFNILRRSGDAYVCYYDDFVADKEEIRCIKRQYILNHPRLYLTGYELDQEIKEYKGKYSASQARKEIRLVATEMRP
jgi:hypothetical protein